MKAETDLRGVVAATVTPFDSAGRVDTGRLMAHCAKMIAAGCGFTSVFGTTGEGASLSTDQKITALNMMAETGMDMSRQVPGIIAASVDDAARLYRAAADLGCRAGLILPPFYYAPTGPEGVADFYAAVVERAGNPGLPILLYNFPHFSGVAFTPELVRRVQDRLGELLVGIKDSTGDLAGGKALVAAFPELSIFTGDDRILPAMVAAGGAGMIGGMVNLFPSDTVSLYQGGVDAAFEARAGRRIVAVDGNGGLIVLKAILAEVTGDTAWRRPLPPLLPLSAAETARVADALELERGVT